MRLTAFTDYCLRALMFVALKGEELATLDENAERYRINRNHLVNAVFRLSLFAFAAVVPGRELFATPKRA
jgi:Rrf2 family nitric oxide-sensitive transcriptional repressor